MLFHFLNFSQCVVCMFGHKKIYKVTNLKLSFTAIHVIMLELKNNKHNTYYHCTYLYIVNAVIFKLLLTYYLKRDLAQKNNNNVTTLICLAISVRAKVLAILLFSILRVWIVWRVIDIICQCELIWLAALARGGAVLKCRLSCSPITMHWDS